MDATPGIAEGVNNSGDFLKKCIENLKTLLGQSNNIGISWEFLTNEQEAELEMRRWIVELKEPIMGK